MIAFPAVVLVVWSLIFYVLMQLRTIYYSKHEND